MLFIGASKCEGLWDKPPTNTPRPANTHRPTKPPANPTDTPVPAYTISPTATLTVTPDHCNCGSTPTEPGIPSCTFTPTLTPSATPTETPTNTPYPEVSTSTQIPTATLTASASPTVTLSGPAAGLAPPSGMDRQTADASAVASWTPIRNRVVFPWSGVDIGSNLSSNAAGMRLTLLLAALMMGGGAVFALVLMNRKHEYDLPARRREGAAAMVIDPVTVGAFGYNAKLSGQIPLLTHGEKVVLTKVGNGIDAAIHHAGSISDLMRISERGAQEFHQLATSSAFLTPAILGIGPIG